MKRKGTVKRNDVIRFVDRDLVHLCERVVFETLGKSLELLDSQAFYPGTDDNGFEMRMDGTIVPM